MKTKIVQGERKCKLVCNLPSRRLFKALPKIVQAGRNPKFFCGLLAVVRRGPQGFLYFLAAKSSKAAIFARFSLPLFGRRLTAACAAGILCTFGVKSTKTIRMSLSRDRRLATLKRAPSRVCGAKECAASTVAARQSPQAASALACCPSFSRPLRALEPPSDLIPPPVQCRRMLCASRNDDYSVASVPGRPSARPIALLPLLFAVLDLLVLLDQAKTQEKSMRRKISRSMLREAPRSFDSAFFICGVK